VIRLLRAIADYFIWRKSYRKNRKNIDREMDDLRSLMEARKYKAWDK
jgi:hypothetical protein